MMAPGPMAGAVELDVHAPLIVKVELPLFPIPGLYAALPPVTEPFTVTVALLAVIRIPNAWLADIVP